MDDERFGRQLVEHPETFPEVWAAWLEGHPGGTVPAFDAWVQQTTGIALGDLLDEPERAGLLALLSPETDADDPSVEAEMVFEGMESGP